MPTVEEIEAEFRPIVRRIARRLSRRVPEHMMAREDIEAVGMLGLLGALKTFDPSLGVPLRPYAIRRIFGSMVDAVRKLDPVPHPTRAALRNAERAGERLSQRLGRQCTDTELSAEIGVHPEAITILRARVSSMSQPRHIDERVAGDEHDPLTLGDTIPDREQANTDIELDEEDDALRRRLRVQLTPLELNVAMAFHVDEQSQIEIARDAGLSLMETMAVLGRVSYKLGARDELGRLIPITPKRKATP